jgi:hypothetical protein
VRVPGIRGSTNTWTHKWRGSRLRIRSLYNVPTVVLGHHVTNEQDFHNPSFN